MLTFRSNIKIVATSLLFELQRRWNAQTVENLRGKKRLARTSKWRSVCKSYLFHTGSFWHKIWKHGHKSSQKKYFPIDLIRDDVAVILLTLPSIITKMYLKISSVKYRPFCPGWYEFIGYIEHIIVHTGNKSHQNCWGYHRFFGMVVVVIL